MTQPLRKVTLAFGLMICINLAHADCWRLPNHRLMRTSVGVKPNIEGAKREPCAVERTAAEQRNLNFLKIQEADLRRQRELQLRREVAEEAKHPIPTSTIH